MIKKLLFAFIIVAGSITQTWSQCAPACGIYTQTSITYTAFPNSGTLVNLGDDDTSGFVPIGFTFNFYCNNYTQVKICSNGFITFDNSVFTTSSTPYAQSLPSTTLPNAVIAYNWNDLDPSAGGTIRYATVGTTPNQMFIVTYSNVPLWSYGGSNTGQIILYEVDGSIEVHIGSAINNGFLTHTEGIENASGTVGSPVSGRNLALWTATTSSTRWQKVIAGTPPTSITGNTLMCFGDLEFYSCTLMSGASSYSWTLPPGWNGSSNTSAITATAGITGSIYVTATYPSCGESLPSVLSVTVNPPPLINIITVAPPVLCSGSVTMVDATGAVSYTLLPVGINGTPPFTLIAQANTNYSLAGTTIDGCVSPTPLAVPLVVYQSPTVSVNSGSICPGQSFTMVPSGANSYSYSSLFSTVTPSIVGTYSYLVVGTATNACVGYAVSTVTVNPLPSTNAITSRTAMCVNETVSLTALGANTYTWANTNSTNTLITVSPGATTIYTLTGKGANGCVKTATLSITVNACTGLNSNQSAGAKAVVYPNPFTGRFTVETEQHSKLIISDISGKEILNNALEPGATKINFEQYPQGVYFLKVLYGTEEENFRLIKE